MSLSVRRINVTIGIECIVVPVTGLDISVYSLVDEAISIYARNLHTEKMKRLGVGKREGTPNSKTLPSNPELQKWLGCVRSVRRLENFGLLDLDAKVVDVLNEDENIILDFDGKKSQFAERCEMEYENKFPSDTYAHLHNLYDKEVMKLDGESLTPDLLVDIGKGRYRLGITDEAIKNVNASRVIVDEIVKKNKVVYGITTGFGKFASTVIDKKNLRELQYSLIRSHAAGVGKQLGIRETRMLFALRINVLCKGYSGISLETLQQLIDAFNASFLPWVPERGTVGASGDLAPLAHLALGLIGEGRVWTPITGWTSAKNALSANNLTPIELKPKEGLCLINGTQLITSIGALALVRSEKIALQADVICALSLEALKGTARAFDVDIGNVRPHRGQIEVAERLSFLLKNQLYNSDINESHQYCDRVQDPYTIRCCPQIHGIVHDTLRFVRSVIGVEINSATDNPLIFAERNEVISAGNFHGEYPAKVLDFLAIGIHELSNTSERRLERLVNPMYSELPAFLTKQGGLNSGFMMAHVTAAALVSENKVLCHPSSIDSLTTSAGQEDHVSMGGFAARKALQVTEHVEYVLAIELLAAVQAIDFLRPLKTTPPLEAVIRVVRSVIPTWDKDRFMAPDIEVVAEMLRENKIWKAVQPYFEDFKRKTPKSFVCAN